jgi:hypothetical protein
LTAALNKIFVDGDEKAQELLQKIKSNSEGKIPLNYEAGKMETQRAELFCMKEDGSTTKKVITMHFKIDPDIYDKGNDEFLSIDGKWIKTSLTHTLIHDFIHSAYNIADENQTQNLANEYCRHLNLPEQFGYSFRRFKKDGFYEDRPISYDEKAGKIINEICEKALKYIKSGGEFDLGEQNDLMALINKDEVRNYIDFKGIVLNSSEFKLNINTGNPKNPEENVCISKSEVISR